MTKLKFIITEKMFSNALFEDAFTNDFGNVTGKQLEHAVADALNKRYDYTDSDRPIFFSKIPTNRKKYDEVVKQIQDSHMDSYYQDEKNVLVTTLDIPYAKWYFPPGNWSRIEGFIEIKTYDRSDKRNPYWISVQQLRALAHPDYKNKIMFLYQFQPGRNHWKIIEGKQFLKLWVNSEVNTRILHHNELSLRIQEIVNDFYRQEQEKIDHAKISENEDKKKIHSGSSVVNPYRRSRASVDEPSGLIPMAKKTKIIMVDNPYRKK